MSALRRGVFGILVFGAGFAGAVWAQPYLARPSLIDSGDHAASLCSGGAFRIEVKAAYSPRLRLSCKDENVVGLTFSAEPSCCIIVQSVDGPYGPSSRVN